MTPSPHWSHASASCLPDRAGPGECRIAWRPSRIEARAVLALGGLAGASGFATELPVAAAALLAAACLLHGWRLARRGLARAPVELVWQGAGALAVDGHAVDAAALQWRGPLAFLRYRDRDGRVRRRVFWPDVLDPPARRELRLAASGLAASPDRASMAP